MSEPPPPRYRVVERGRRLEVIDNWTGHEATRHIPDQPAVRRGRERGALMRAAGGLRARGQDASTFTTRAFYDDKAPRVIRLDYATVGKLKQARMVIAVVIAVAVVFGFLMWPLTLVALFASPALLGTQARARMRRQATRWLDTLAQSTGADSSRG